MHRERRQSRTGAEHVVDRWPGNVVCLLFFQAGLFPKNRAEPFFIHISMVVTRSSKAATPRCRNRFRMAHHARPFLRLFSRHGCSPRSGLLLCTDASYIYVTFFRRHATFYQNVPLRDQSATKKNAFYTSTTSKITVLFNYFFVQSLINKKLRRLIFTMLLYAVAKSHLTE